jgi:hypothetical protein
MHWFHVSHTVAQKNAFYFKHTFTKSDKKRNTEIFREFKINPVLEHIYQHRNNWKQHLPRMERSRIPRQMMTYRPKGKRFPWKTL